MDIPNEYTPSPEEAFKQLQDFANRIQNQMIEAGVHGVISFASEHSPQVLSKSRIELNPDQNVNTITPEICNQLMIGTLQTIAKDCVSLAANSIDHTTVEMTDRLTQLDAMKELVRTTLTTALNTAIDLQMNEEVMKIIRNRNKPNGGNQNG